ncbi:MAG: hypothetical protein AAGI52_01115 [Bacteroidota bacterium]
MPPVAAIVTGFFMVAAPVILMMTIWTLVTMWRVIFPDDELPFDRSTDVAAAQERGESVPVGFVDIMEQQRRRPVGPVMPHRQRVAQKEGTSESPLAEDLWRRRN